MTCFASLALWTLLAVQDPGPDRLLTDSGDDVRGQIVRMEPDGSLVVKTATGSRTIALDDLRKMQFEDNPEVAVAKEGERIWPRVGGTLTGTILSFDAKTVSIKCSHGTYSLRRDEVR